MFYTNSRICFDLEAEECFILEVEYVYS